MESRKAFLFLTLIGSPALSAPRAAVSLLGLYGFKRFADSLLFADFKFNLYQGMDVSMEATFLIKSLPFFQSLSPLEGQQLIKHSRIKTYERRKTLFMQGDAANRYFIVVNGWVKIYQLTSLGNEAVSSLVTSGESFGESVLGDEDYNSVYSNSAETMDGTTTLELPARILKNIVLNNPDLAIYMMHVMSQRVKKLQLENEHLMVMSTAQRVACFLLQTYLMRCGESKEALVFPYDKNLIAARLGMQPETFSRALKDLRSRGVLIVRNTIYIESPQKLKSLCCVNCSSQPESCTVTNTYMNHHTLRQAERV
jgi:CRP-like cAMP-binding protein